MELINEIAQSHLSTHGGWKKGGKKQVKRLNASTKG
jgi:hypothetical protein